ncbi:uncharacterized protein PRCAT00003239001 [Priceomyces carsonii]|uniref:uncharacterized protein n=1 Tax=Priceomyces carsonii TaxID=28549 RepID=UPI002ED8ACAF|nr:unnamed protein product [Priceomyces carsonii]
MAYDNDSLHSDSLNSLATENELIIDDQTGYQSEAIPLDLRSVADDALSRHLSRIQSKRSSVPSNNETSEDLEANLKKSMSISSDKKFSRFPERTKRLCVAIAAISGFLSPLSSLTFLPAIPEIAARFNTTAEVINISSAVYCIFMSLSPCVFSPLSDIYGRRNTFLWCCSLFTVTTILVAVSQNLAMFYVFRSLTALFGTSFFSIGGHIVGDLYPPVLRGTNMSYIVMGSQVGTGFGGVIGGIIVNFTSWRVIFWVLAGIGCSVFVMALVFLPETLEETKHSIILREARKENPKKKFVFIGFNPLRIMTALKYPNLSINGYISIAILYNMYNLLTPIRKVVDPRFDLTEPIYSGLFYLPPGVGYLIGSLFGGRWADYVVKRYIKKRGRRVPEDRLRTVLIPLGIVYPVSMLIYGWSIEKKVGGMAVPIIFMFLSGVAQTCIFPATNTYCVDSMPELHGDGIASSYFSRYLAGAVASATCLRSIDSIGVGWSCTISAFILWLGLVCSVILIRYGETLRVKALVRYGLRSQKEILKK